MLQSMGLQSALLRLDLSFNVFFLKAAGDLNLSFRKTVVRNRFQSLPSWIEMKTNAARVFNWADTFFGRDSCFQE